MSRLQGLTLSVAAVALCGLAWSVEPAGAQQRAGGDGRALDANPRSGSGGSNRREGQVDYRRRNDVVTGNVSGGRGFRDNVGYRAPNELRTRLGSDDQFDFRARSLQSSPSRVRSTPRAGVGGQSVYRSFSGSADVGNAPRSTQIIPRGTGLYDPGAFSQGQTPLTPGDFALEGEAERGAAEPARGGDGVSPLVPADRGLSPRGGEDGFEALEGLGESGDVAGEAEDTEDESDQQDARQSRLDVRLRDRLSGRLDDSRRSRGLLQQEGLTSQRLLSQRPASFLGRQMQAQLLRDQPMPRTLDQRVTRMEEALFNQLEGRQASGPDRAYRNVLEAMKSQRRPAAEEDAASADDDWLAKIYQQQTLPSEQAIRSAERERDEAFDSAFRRQRAEQDQGQDRGEKQAPRQGDKAADEDERLSLEQELARQRGEAEEDGEAGDDGEAGKDGDGQRGQSLEQMLAKLDYENQPLESLAGDRETRVDELLKRAEKQMAAGEFFSAERTYQQLLIDAPERPLVRAGLVNAKLGAGLIRSAALHMRKLFNEHPELIATRYDKALLPPAKRLRWLQKELQRMIQQNRAGSRPGMMLAYLGYQTKARQLVRYGLATAQSEAPRDPLLPVLRRIWLDEGGPQPEPEAQPKGEAAPQGEGSDQSATPTE